MKTLILSLVLLVTSLNAYAVIGPVGRSTNLAFDGTIVNGSKEQHFINVINKSGGALVAGNVVVWDVSNDDGASVKTSVTAGDVPACVITEACASNALCKMCQVWGYSALPLFSTGGGSATAGKMAFISETNAGYVAADSSPAATDYPIGIFYDSPSATGAVELMIRIQ